MLLSRSSLCGSWHESACLDIVHVKKKLGDVDGLYGMLGVEPDASDDEVRKAGKRLVMETHPDRGGDEDEFLAAVEAYKTLSDPESRAAYDVKGSAPTVTVRAGATWNMPVREDKGEPAWYKEPTDVLSAGDIENVRKWHGLMLEAAREFRQPFEIKVGICNGPAGYYTEGDIYLIGHDTVPQRWAAYANTLKRMVEND